MKLIFIRHGKAAAKKSHETEMEDFGRDLTHDGIVDIKEITHTCRFIFKNAHTIFSSPLVRAVRTAQILHREYPRCLFELMPSLDKSCDPEVFIRELRHLDSSKSYCFVGHEPHLSQSINILLKQYGQSVVKIEKGGVVVLEGHDLHHLQITALISPKMISKFTF